MGEFSESKTPKTVGHVQKPRNPVPFVVQRAIMPAKDSQQACAACRDLWPFAVMAGLGSFGQKKCDRRDHAHRPRPSVLDTEKMESEIVNR
jgi:hypothetical protein